jgi:hypothetical protein
LSNLKAVANPTTPPPKTTISVLIIQKVLKILEAF